VVLRPGAPRAVPGRLDSPGAPKEATRLLLDRAAAAARWGTVHAFPGVTNAASNGICRGLGFALVAQVVLTFNGRRLPTNHWVLDPAAIGRAANATT
jgi:RimJ/RimL family protein N-acetyltransferase